MFLLIFFFADLSGKKIFVGTHTGRVLLLDSATLGILTQLTHEESHGRDGHGPVRHMVYGENDELLVVAHTNGALKIFSGCHRTASAEYREKYVHKVARKYFTQGPPEWCPLSLGGNTPYSPVLLRSNHQVHDSSVLSMDFSEELGIIAVSGSDGTGKRWDWCELYIFTFTSVFFTHNLPVLSSQSDSWTTTHC
jgi:WD40 repeat protein